MYLQQWAGHTTETSTNRLYRHIKDSFCFENYLNINNKSLRVSITKIRLSSHLFNIERGRWGNVRVPVVNRVCSNCNVIEDEYHCLIECPRYVSERRGCVPERLRKRPSMYEFIKYLKGESEADYRTLGLLCMRVMKKHRMYI